MLNIGHITSKKIAQIRARAGLTQEAMAKELGVSRRFFTYREQGKYPVPRWLAYAMIAFNEINKK